MAECMDAQDYNSIDLGFAAAFLGGYEHERRLDDAEWALLPALFRAQLLWFVTYRLVEWRTTGGQRPVASIARTVEKRLPALDAVTPGLLARRTR